MNKSRLILILVFLAAVLIRISFLSADPSILLDSGQVGDEGLWVYNARNLALFGKTVEDDFYSDIAAAPVFLLFAFLNFSLFGIGFWQARLISGVFGKDWAVHICSKRVFVDGAFGFIPVLR